VQAPPRDAFGVGQRVYLRFDTADCTIFQ